MVVARGAGSAYGARLRQPAEAKWYRIPKAGNRMIEMRRRKAGKNGVVTTLGIPAGHMVTVARVDERTELVSLEPVERVEAMAAALQAPGVARHKELMARLQSRAHDASAMPRAYTGPERDSALSEVDVKLVASRVRNRRTF